MIHPVSSRTPGVDLITTVTDTSKYEMNEEHEDKMNDQLNHLLDCLVFIIIVKGRKHNIWSFIFTSLKLEHLDNVEYNNHNKAYASDKFCYHKWEEEKWSFVKESIDEHQEANHFEEEEDSVPN